MSEKVIYSLLAIALFAGLIFIGYSWGVSSTEAEYTTRVVELQERAKLLEDGLQSQAIDIAAQKNLRMAEQVAHDGKVGDLIEQIRSKRNEKKPQIQTAECICRPDPMYPAYIVHNEAADSPSLPDNPDRQEPDAEADGLEVVQYTAAEYNRVAIQLTSLIETVELAPCIE